MARKPWVYGKSIVDGRVRFLSPSAIIKADAGTGGCLRQFYFRYVLGMKEDATDKPWLELGEQLHAEMEQYILTGANALGRITSSTRRFAPRGEVLIEHDIGGGRSDLSGAKLTADGVPIVGYTDFLSGEPAIQDLGDDGVTPYDDPPGTLEVGDWKFPTNARGTERDFSRKEHELADDIQLVTYGEFAARVSPALEDFRLSLIYTNTKGRSESWKVSTLVSRDHLAKRWEYVEAVVRTIRQAARETDVEKVEANASACDRYGGCAYREFCSVGKNAGLEDFFGATASESFVNSLKGPPMSSTLLSGLNLPAVKLGLLPDGAHAMASGPQPSGTYIAAVRAIHSKGYGFPPLSGEAAAMYAVLNGRSILNAAGNVDGWGRLGQLEPISEGARVEGVAAELAAVPVNPTPDTKPAPIAPVAPPIVPTTTPPVMYVAASAVAPLGILPPDAPASNPALAALPVDGFNALTPGVQIPGLIASVPAATAAVILAEHAAPQTEAIAEVKRGRGRPRKDAATADRVAIKEIVELAYSAPEPAAPRSGAIDPNEDRHREFPKVGAIPEYVEVLGRSLYLNCRPNLDTVDLAPMIDAWALAAAKHFRCEPLDIRCAKGNDNAAAFGGWKGVMAATARKMATTLEPGHYVLRVDGNDIYAAAAEGFLSAHTDAVMPVFGLVVRG